MPGRYAKICGSVDGPPYVTQGDKKNATTQKHMQIKNRYARNTFHYVTIVMKDPEVFL